MKNTKLFVGLLSMAILGSVSFCKADFIPDGQNMQQGEEDETAPVREEDSKAMIEGEKINIYKVVGSETTEQLIHSSPKGTGGDTGGLSVHEAAVAVQEKQTVSKVLVGHSMTGKE